MRDENPPNIGDANRINAKGNAFRDCAREISEMQIMVNEILLAITKTRTCNGSFRTYLGV